MPHSSGASHELLWECEGTVMMLAAHLSCFIDNKLTAEYGTDHLYSTLPDGNYRFEADIRTKKENRCADNPARARKTIREATFEQTIDVICREDLYASLFQDDLLQVFPKGRSDCIAFFKGLIEQRNRVNETDQISVRDAEQIVSDSNRISDLLRKQCFDFKMATDPEFRKKYASLASRS